jgi:hypothetical protein
VNTLIADNGSTDAKRPILIALEDAVLIGIYTFVGGLIATGSAFPPSMGVLYASGLVSVLAGAVSWAKARNVPLSGG